MPLFASLNQKFRLLEQFREFRRQEIALDFSIICGENIWRCHSIVLAACSTVVRDAIKDGNYELEVTNLEKNTIDLLVDYAYCGEVNIDNWDIVMVIEFVIIHLIFYRVPKPVIITSKSNYRQ